MRLYSFQAQPARCCDENVTVDLAAKRSIRNRSWNMDRTGSLSSRSNQQGIALAVALILLVVLTLVGIAAVRGTIMQQKMASNFSDRQVAFQVGEAGLRQAQISVQALATPISVSALPATIRNCSPTGGVKCLANPFNDSLPTGAIQTVTLATFNAGALASAQPQYVIDYMGNFKAPTPIVQQLSGCSGYAPCGLTSTADYYRITVTSGAAASDRATVVLQSMFRR